MLESKSSFSSIHRMVHCTIDYIENLIWMKQRKADPIHRQREKILEKEKLFVNKIWFSNDVKSAKNNNRIWSKAAKPNIYIGFYFCVLLLFHRCLTSLLYLHPYNISHAMCAHIWNSRCPRWSKHILRKVYANFRNCLFANERIFAFPRWPR